LVNDESANQNCRYISELENGLERLERDKLSEQLVPTGRHRALENSSMLRSASLPLTISYRFREIVLIFRLSIDEVDNLVQTVTSSDETQLHRDLDNNTHGGLPSSIDQFLAFPLVPTRLPIECMPFEVA
jgi:hypothetical protein